MEDLVSIIVPVYKVKKYLLSCINSIQCQSYRNIEILLIDDGSPDRCGYICEELAKNDLRIAVIHKKNGGLSSARNVGLNYAHGKYIMFVDSDDKIEDNMVEELYNLLKNNNADIAYSAKKNVYDSEELKNELEKYKEEYNDKITIGSSKEMIKKNFEEIDRWEVWGKLYDAKLFKKNKFLKGIVHEDLLILPRLMYEAKQIVYINKPLYLYTIRSGSTMMYATKYIANKDLVRVANLNLNYFIKDREIFDIVSAGMYKILYMALCRIVLEDNVNNNSAFINEYIKFFNKKKKEFCNNNYVKKKRQIKLSFTHFRVFFVSRKILTITGHYS